VAGWRDRNVAEHCPVEPGTQHGSADAEVAVERASLTRICDDVDKIGHRHGTG
jgi:hypothetical protein